MPDIPGNASTSATIAVGGSIGGSLETAGDTDWYRIDLTAGQSISIAVDGLTLGDPIVRVRSADGTIIFTNDDGGPGVNSLLAFTASSSGTYFIDVGSAPNTQTGSYQLSVSAYSPPPVASLDAIAHWMTDGFWDGDRHHFDVGSGGTITVNLTALTEDSRTVARAALQLWSDVIGITFAEVSSGGQIVFDDLEDGTGAFSDGVWSNGITTSATVNVSALRLGTGPDIFRVGLQTYIHEIGHALGLGHAGDYNGGTAYSRYPYEAMFLNDGAAVSVMSYFDNGENSYYASRGFSNVLVATPQVADIIAVADLYGLSTTTRTGDTTYGFNNNSGRSVFDAAHHPNVAYTIVDSGGKDTLDYSGFASGQVINLNPETFSNVGALVGNVVIAPGTIIENAIGGSGDDRLIGNAAANVLRGGAGNDTLIGGLGADTMSGGLGDDSYYVDDSGDRAIEENAAGIDTVFSSVSYRLGDNVEKLNLTGSAIRATGNALDNRLVGNDGDNILDGRAGADIMRGGLGDDRYYVDNAHDRAIENSAQGTDTVISSVTYAIAGNVENLVLTGSAFRANGNTMANSLVGTDGDNILNGAGGADVMRGGGGNDTYFVDNFGDAVIESAGAGNDRVYTTVSYTAAANVEDIFIRGAGSVDATGNALDNSIRGNGANNVITGGAGLDRVTGGGGADTFVFHDGDFAGMGPGTADQIRDFSTLQGDRIDLSGVDANTLSDGDQAFGFIGTAGFHHVAGELRYDIVNGTTYVYGDTNGDGLSDFMIRLDGNHTMSASDFGL